MNNFPATPSFYKQPSNSESNIKNGLKVKQLAASNVKNFNANNFGWNWIIPEKIEAFKLIKVLYRISSNKRFPVLIKFWNC